MRCVTAVLTLAIVASPVASLLAQEGPAIVVKGERPEKKICKTYEAPTGSRVGERRLCKTKSEWKLADDATQRNMDRENLRAQADQAQTLNERGALARKLPH